MEPAVTVSHLSKQYKKGTRASYVALRDVLAAAFQKKEKMESNHFWALEDVNFTVQKGERVGIIGPNGAGKSTLLKIISRITPPTAGKVVLEGRVASLLEVGTGFHPELTGRENIFLNGSILGLSKSEITWQLDAIIDFSGVEAFIDTPLKHYSSGMQLRLAFSVAAHLDPEILLIDEVLAVGDFEFQKKCLGKMEEISRKSGRTILFVSHNMAAIRQLCTGGIVLKDGRCVYQGNIREAVNLHTRNFLDEAQRLHKGVFLLDRHPNKAKTGEGIMKASLHMNGVTGEDFLPGGTMVIDVTYFLQKPLTDPEIGVVIKDNEYNPVIGLNNLHIGSKLDLKTGVLCTAKITIPNFNIYTPGKYLVDLYLGDQYRFYECLYDAFQFNVLPHDVYESGTELRPEWNKIFIPNIQITT
jgi:lipopolysaccharide transport system ATP-binding protein